MRRLLPIMLIALLVIGAGGWITGSWPVDGKAYLFATRDGGKTWSAVTLLFPGKYAKEMLNVEPPVFSKSGEGTLAINLYGEGRVTLFFSTKERGETWEFSGELKSAGDRFFLSTVNASDLHVFDGERFFASAAGGKSWTSALPIRTLADVTSVQFASGLAGWVVQGGALLKTIDGGKTWAAAGDRQS